MLGSNFALLVKSPGDDAQLLLTTVSRYVYISLGKTDLISGSVAKVLGGGGGGGAGVKNFFPQVLRSRNSVLLFFFVTPSARYPVYITKIYT